MLVLVRSWHYGLLKDSFMAFVLRPKALPLASTPVYFEYYCQMRIVFKCHSLYQFLAGGASKLNHDFQHLWLVFFELFLALDQSLRPQALTSRLQSLTFRVHSLTLRTQALALTLRLQSLTLRVQSLTLRTQALALTLRLQSWRRK